MLGMRELCESKKALHVTAFGSRVNEWRKGGERWRWGAEVYK